MVYRQFEQGKFQSQNVSELKSSSGNSLSDYINYFAEHGEQVSSGSRRGYCSARVALKNHRTSAASFMNLAQAEI